MKLKNRIYSFQYSQSRSPLGAERLFYALIFRNLPQDFLFPARGFFVFSRKNLHLGI